MEEERVPEAEETEEIRSVHFEHYKRSQKITLKNVIDFAVYLLIVVILCLLFIRFVAVRSVVDGDSMNPLVYDGDNLIVEKVSYYFRAPERFDVIVFELKNEKGVHFIKRIVGLPGETVQIKDGAVYIDGRRLENDVYGLAEIRNAYLAGEPVELGENEYFVLGDNRNNSKDSRIIGPVERKQFLGRAFFRFFPFGKMGLIRHD